jgi:predicted acyl esterase
VNSWGGWFDASTADAVIKSFLSLANYQRAIVGPWNHGGSQNASPYQTAESQRVMQAYEWLRFFDHHLKGIDTGLDSEKLFYYFTLVKSVGRQQEPGRFREPGGCAGIWMTATLCLRMRRPPLRGLTLTPSTLTRPTGEKNRWHTQVGGQVFYPDRAEEDRKLLVYTSAPFDTDTEVTGYPIINLFVTSTASDGAFLVYLEDINDKGVVTYVTEGALRALHRKVSADTLLTGCWFLPFIQEKRRHGRWCRVRLPN